MSFFVVLLLCIASGALTTVARGDDPDTSGANSSQPTIYPRPTGNGAGWPQFRGPTGQGHAGTTPTSINWGERSGIKWKTDLPGTGHASPVILGDQIWLATSSANGKSLGAVCLDRESGKITQTVTVFKPTDVQDIHNTNSHASPTPVLDAGRLYVDYGRYGAACIDTITGQTLWTNTDLAIEHQGGPGSSPIPYGELIILHRDGADAQYVVAIEKETGNVRWKQDRSAPFRPDPITHRAFATPLIVTHDGRDQLISPGADQTHAYDPTTGEELWHVRYTGFSNVPCPVVDDGMVLLCTGFFQPSMIGVRLGGKENITDTHIAWTHKAQVPDTPSPLIVDGRVYLVSNKGVLNCLVAATGKKVFTKRLGGNFSASPLDAGGHIYFCSEEGLTTVMLPDEKGTIVETNKLGGQLMASPAAVEGAIYLRTEAALYRTKLPEQPDDSKEQQP